MSCVTFFFGDEIPELRVPKILGKLLYFLNPNHGWGRSKLPHESPMKLSGYTGSRTAPPRFRNCYFSADHGRCLVLTKAAKVSSELLTFFLVDLPFRDGISNKRGIVKT